MSKKIENARKLFEKAIETEDEEKHGLIVDSVNADEIIKQLQPSLVIYEDEKSLDPLIYTLPDGLTVKGLAKKTKDGRILGKIKVELADGRFLMGHENEIEYESEDELKAEAEEVYNRFLTSFLDYKRGIGS